MAKGGRRGRWVGRNLLLFPFVVLGLTDFFFLMSSQKPHRAGLRKSPRQLPKSQFVNISMPFFLPYSKWQFPGAKACMDLMILATGDLRVDASSLVAESSSQVTQTPLVGWLLQHPHIPGLIGPPWRPLFSIFCHLLCG